MSNSSLVDVKVPAYSGNYTKGRSGKKISEITIHHMAGVLTPEQCGKVFQKVGRKGSSHYGIGSDGRIGLYVDEKNTAWTNSNWEANCRAVTIETSNSKTGGDWPVSDKALNSLIELVADIAKRNNLGKLVKGENLTWHRMYSKTTCPGEYLLSKMDYIVEKANEILEEKEVNVSKNNITNYTVKITTDVLNVRNGAGTKYKVNTTVKKGEVYTIVEEKNGWGKLKSGVGWISLAYASKNITTKASTSYYPKCESKYTSIVSALNSIKVNSSYSNRARIAKKNNIKLYIGTASQNTRMLNLLKNGKLIKI